MQGPYHTTPANFMVRVEAISEAILTDLEILGPNEVPDNNSTQYVAIAFYSDGSGADVTEEANWFVGANSLATIDANGILKTQELEMLQELIFISAKYAENDVNVTDEKGVLIFADCSITELIGRNVRGAIDIKQKILESLTKALEKEERAKSMLEEFSEHPSFSNWSKNDMIGLGQKLSWSIRKENHAQGALNESLKKLQEAQQNIAD
jgi:hypothetical protein